MPPIATKYRHIFLYAGLFSFVINLAQLVPSLYWMQIFDRVIAAHSHSTLYYMTAGVVVTLCFGMLFELLRSRLLVITASWIDQSVAPRLFRYSVRRPTHPNLPPYPEGMRDLMTVRNFITGVGIFALFDVPWLPIYILLIYVFSPLLGAACLAGALLILVVGIANEKMSRNALDSTYRETAAANRYVDNVTRNWETVLPMGMEGALQERWQTLNRNALGHQAHASHVVAASMSLTRLVRQLVQLMVMAVGVLLILDQNTSPGIMMAATFISARAFAPVEQLVSGWAHFAEARAAFLRLRQFLTEQPDETESHLELPAPRGALEFDKVLLIMPDRPAPIIKGGSFRVEAGEMIGIIGPSGAGKSTLLRLAVGLWQPTGGTVRLDGGDIHLWDAATLGQHIGYLPQHVDLFPGTIAENIARMGTPDPEQVIHAAQLAGIHELVLRLPQGYDTPLTEAGLNLSGGQKQRVALARALYGSPRLVVLDEPNANMDSEGEAALARAFADLKQRGVTILVAAHRPSILEQADKILVVQDGLYQAFGPRQQIFGQYSPPVAGEMR